MVIKHISATSSLRNQSWLFSLILIMCFFFVVPVAVGGENNDVSVQSARTLVQELTKAFAEKDKNKNLSDQFSENIAALSVLRGRMQKCVDVNTAEIEKYKTGAVSNEHSAIAKSKLDKKVLTDFEIRKSKLNNELVTCSAMLIEIDSLSDDIRERRKGLLASHLLAKDPGIVESLVNNVSQLNHWLNTVQLFLKNRLQLQLLSFENWVWLIVVLMLFSLIGKVIRQKMNSLAATLSGKELTTQLVQSLCISMARIVPYVLVATGVLIVLMFAQDAALSPSGALLIALICYLLLTAIFGALLNPYSPAKIFIGISVLNGRRIYRRLKVLILLGVLVLVAYVIDLRTAMTLEQWQISRSIILILGSINLVWLSLILNRMPGLIGSALVRSLIVLVLLISILAEVSGYRNFSYYLIQGLLGSALFAIALWLISALLTDIFDGLDQGRYNWQLQLRKKLRLNKNEPLPGLLWLRLIAFLAIWTVFIVSVIRLWGYSTVSWAGLMQIITDGFVLGDYRIVPARLILAIVVFSLLIASVRWFKQGALPVWINRTRMDHGAREALTSIFGYVGVILAAVFGLSLAGFSFTNIAIVAGALSVGIGFGLQNIVNNFISGIILLFERPIRTGDWIVVGNTEGYVRKISIRSTQIETFDRADVIVPNSELISNQVVNWMLHDPWGRVIVPVGVAYGSDVEKVREVLLKVASEHELVLQDESKVSPPKVLFRGFGDSSLNFELRCYLRNVDRRLDTSSDLNFAIDKAFREANIEIAYPQRDLHLRSVAEGISFSRDVD